MVPLGAGHLNALVADAVVRRTAALFVLAIQMAAPLLAVAFIVVLVFSVLGRAVPQMNVFFESFAVRTMAGLLVFAMALPLMAQYITSSLNRLPEDVLRIAQFMGAR